MWKEKRKSTNKKLERKFQSELKKEIEEHLGKDDLVITKLDPSHAQGIPDLLILYKDKWATLECKRNEKAEHQPNQDFYVEKMDRMSFSRFIYPENKEEVLDELYRSFKA